MKVNYQRHDIAFEWDRQKAAENRRKHGVVFEVACEVFFDPFVYAVGGEFENDEWRESVIGMTEKWQILYVVYTWRGDVLRIISARPAVGVEKQQYENQ